jgi:predicted RNA-binding Zn-ribbon protein involved in translation (DUF1610 family)
MTELQEYIITEEMVVCIEAWTKRFPIVSKDIASVIRSRPAKESSDKVLKESWRKCPTCGDDLIYSHRVTVNSWTYICQNCKTTHYVMEDEKTKERTIDVYDKHGKLRTKERKQNV